MARVGASLSVLGGRYSGVSSVGVVCTPTVRVTIGLVFLLVRE